MLFFDRGCTPSEKQMTEFAEWDNSPMCCALGFITRKYAGSLRACGYILELMDLLHG